MVAIDQNAVYVVRTMLGSERAGESEIDRALAEKLLRTH